MDNARSRIIFSNKEDHGVYTLSLDGQNSIDCIVQHHGWRFADFDVHPKGLIVAIRETHPKKDSGADDVINELAVFDPSSGNVKVLVSGADFYSSARFSTDGKKICWMEWNHPNMPWTGSKLFLASFDEKESTVTGAALIAGSENDRGISQPRWGPDGTLFYADDITGYWQLYMLRSNSKSPERVIVQALEQTDHAGAEFKLGRYVLIFLMHNDV